MVVEWWVMTLKGQNHFAFQRGLADSVSANRLFYEILDRPKSAIIPSGWPVLGLFVVHRCLVQSTNETWV